MMCSRLNCSKKKKSTSPYRIRTTSSLSFSLLIAIMATAISISKCWGFELASTSARLKLLGSRINTASRRRSRIPNNTSNAFTRQSVCFASMSGRNSCDNNKLSSVRPLLYAQQNPLDRYKTAPFIRNPLNLQTKKPPSYPYYSTRHKSSLSSTTTETHNVPSATTPEIIEDEEDTIFALSSGGGGASVGSGATAVAVIRISGACAFDALRELLSPYPLVGSSEKGGGEENDGEDTTIKVKVPKLPKARMASLRTLYDPLTHDNNNNHNKAPTQQQQKRDPLDSALILTFPGPNSFTGEDIVELHCHGSRAVVQGVLAALSSLHFQKVPSLSSNGDSSTGNKTLKRLALRPADPGEFTQRAYAHGKLGLVEVEALADLIVSDTSLQRKQALQQFDGRLSRLYMGWREELIKGLAHAEAVIDFGDDEVLDEDEDDVMYDGILSSNNGNADGGMSVWGTIPPRISSLRQAMDRHLADASRGELLRDGLRIAIVGRPNAGKSSLLNLLAGRDAAIVSSTPGTTRDVVEVILDLGGVRCTLLDTAGVREEKEEGVNDIEVEGMKRARRAARDAHIVVGVVDASDCERGLDAVTELIHRGDEEEDEEEEEDYDDGLAAVKKENVLYVLNKLDLVEENNGEVVTSSIDGKIPKGSSFGISCSTSEGVDAFLSSLTEHALSMVSDGNADSTNAAVLSVEGTEGAVITRARHRRHVEAASDALARFERLSGQGYMALDMAAEELRLAASELGRVTGAIDVENILDVLFADFCIGK